MTSSAQAALRRTMEKETRTTRFCLICNYVSRIIQPLTSRCTKFRFKPLSNEIIKKRLIHIATQENVQYDEQALDTLIECSEGDLRKAITYLQCAAKLKIKDVIKASDIYEIAGVIKEETIRKLLDVCASNSFEKVELFVQVNFS
jgi:replication factor C subunit 2/4